MPTLRFVIGPPASGKSWFVRNRLAAEAPCATVRRYLEEIGWEPSAIFTNTGKGLSVTDTPDYHDRHGGGLCGEVWG